MTKRRRLRFQARATDEIVEADRWWRAHRDSSTLFVDEVTEALQLLAAVPSIGTPSAVLVGVRRFLLRKTQYHLFYRVHEEELEVLALWHAVREPPTL